MLSRQHEPSLQSKLGIYTKCAGCRGLKVAALATVANLAVLEANKAACSKLRVVPRLVALLDRSVPSDVRAMATGALTQLVLKDVNRLKCWRSGGVEKLKAIVDSKAPRVRIALTAAQEVKNVLLLFMLFCHELRNPHE
jgi:Armadillo/beta-catenin-like repeat